MNKENCALKLVDEINQNSIQEEIKSRLKSGSACYYSMQNILSSTLLSKNLKIEIYRIIILSVVLYGCETWSLTLREERRLRVFENRVLRRTFGPKRNDVTREWRKLYNDKPNDLYFSLNVVRVIKSRKMRWVGRVACMGRGEVHTGFWWGNLRERGHLDDSGVDGTIILRWIFRKWDVEWNELDQVAGTCECENDPSGSIKCGNYLTS